MASETDVVSTTTFNTDPATTAQVLLSLAGRLTRWQTDALANLDVPLTLRQYRLLRRVRDGHTTAAELARLARRSLPTISQSIDVLVRNELLSRQRSERDRRVVELTLTSHGEGALEIADRAVEAIVHELASRVPEGLTGPLLDALHELYEGTTQYLEWENRALGT